MTTTLAPIRLTPALGAAVRAAAGYAQFQAARDNQCRADFTTGGPDPYGTGCDLPAGHVGSVPHEGPNPFGGPGKVTWRGGGGVAGDPLPYTDVQFDTP